MLGTSVAAKHSLYGLPYSPGINFAARRKTFSKTSLSFLRSGHHIEMQYSKCGLTMELHKQRKDVLSECQNV